MAAQGTPIGLRLEEPFRRKCGRNFAAARAPIPLLSKDGYQKGSKRAFDWLPHRSRRLILPERLVRFLARQKSNSAHCKPHLSEVSLLNEWANPKVHCDSALGIKLDRPFPVHFVEIEYAFAATPQHAKELTAVNPIIGHVVNPFSLQCN